MDAGARATAPRRGEEAEVLLGYLQRQRDTLRWKCAGLDAAALARTHPPSTLTLGGVVKHLAVVEAGWLNLTFAGGVARPSWLGEMDPDDEDWSFTSAARAQPAQLLAWFEESVAVSDRVVADALAGPDGLATLSVAEDDGERFLLRWVLLHLIEEYARHLGHADLLREAIDGQRGD